MEPSDARRRELSRTLLVLRISSAFIGVGRRLHEQNAEGTADVRRWPPMGMVRAPGAARLQRGKEEKPERPGAAAPSPRDLVFWPVSAFVGGYMRRMREEPPISADGRGWGRAARRGRRASCAQHGHELVV